MICAKKLLSLQTNLHNIYFSLSNDQTPYYIYSIVHSSPVHGVGHSLSLFPTRDVTLV